MPLNHANACAHLNRECMYIHSIVKQRKGRVCVTQAIQRSVLPCTRTCDQPCIRKELAERLVDVLADSAIRQSEHRQIDTLLEQVFKRYVLDVVTPLMDALEVIDRSTAADDVPATSLAGDAHL